MSSVTIQETKILPAKPGFVTVEILVADHSDPALATVYVRGKYTFEPQMMQGHSLPYLAHVQRQALHELREVLGAETQRLSSPVNR